MGQSCEKYHIALAGAILGTIMVLTTPSKKQFKLQESLNEIPKYSFIAPAVKEKKLVPKFTHYGLFSTVSYQIDGLNYSWLGIFRNWFSWNFDTINHN